MSLSVRFLLLVLLAMIPAVCVEIYGEIELRAERQREIHDQALRLMRLVAAEQERIGEGTRQLLIAFAETAAVRSGDWSRCNSTAGRIHAQVEEYTNLGVANLNGELLCSALPVPAGLDMRRNPAYLRLTPESDLVVGTYQEGRITGAKILSYAMPWRNERGEVLGMIWATLDLDWLARHFGDRFSSPKIMLLIADTDGRILVRLPDQEKWVGRPLGDPYASWLHAETDGVVDTTDIDGVERIIAYSPLGIEPKGLYLGVGLAKAPLFARIDQATRDKALLISFTVGLALLAAWLGGSTFIRRPIKTLLLATRRWQEGDYSARARLTDRSSEIGALGRGFDEMAEALETRERERRAAEEALARLNSELEQRVKDEVAEREKAQAALVQAQKIEAIGQLTSGVAHDFNNLLAAVLGNLELLRRRTTDPGLMRLVDGATRAATRGAKLTEQLLAFSRHHHLEPVAFDLNALIGGMGELLNRSIGPAIRVVTLLAPDLWPVFADASQIEIALLNLAINARDAMPSGGILRLETANLPAGDVRLPAALAGDCVMVSVADTGTGMSVAVKARAFEPFFTTKEVGKGTGLGLSMVWGVAEQSGGTVIIDSAPGEGTTISLFLPRAEAAAAPAEEDAEAAPASGASTGVHPRILVVDDDHDVRELTLAVLDDRGFETLAADSGEEALAMLERGAPVDLMIVDFAMPGLSGADVVRRARDKRPALPAILITGYAEAGVTADLPPDVQLLRKPFRIGELLDRVQAAVDAAPRVNTLAP